MADQKVLDVQNWMNNTYYGNQNWKVVDEDGETGIETVTGLIRALQIELGLDVDGSFGPGTKSAFNSLYPSGLSKNTVADTQQLKNINVIVNGGLFCRGIAGDWNYLELFSDTTEEGIITMKTQLGMENPDGVVRGIDMKAILTTDAYTTINNTYNIKVREIQQALNRKYLNMMGDYLATNGLYDRNTNKTIKMAVQYEIGVTPDGSWGNATKNALPALTIGSSNTDLIYLLQYLLFLNGFDPNGFDGSFGNGARSAVMQFQELMHLEVDGSVGPQTWFALAVSCGDTSRAANACDTRFEITAERAQVLKQNGYEVVGRYINGGDFKELREGELETIFDAGLKAFFIYQENNRLISDFSFEKGMEAALRANIAAKKHNIQKGSIIYFAVDLDVYEDQIESYIVPYFNGISQYLSEDYKVGIYGPRLVCTTVSARGLSNSSFVADMSSGYSCNIGQKIPEDWCYDQYVEISNFNNDFDIDKVTYNGKIEASNTIEESKTINNDVYEFLEKIYNLAEQYCQENEIDYDIPNKNILVLQYLRCDEYKGEKWNIVASNLNTDWTDYVKSKIDNQRKNNIFIYTNGDDIKYRVGLIHWAVTTESNMAKYNNPLYGIEAQMSITDLAGWAGDLISFTAKIDDEYETTGVMKDNNELENLIGGFNSYTFDYEDFIQDIDAVNLYLKLNSKKISEALREYYDDGEYKHRYNLFLMNWLAVYGIPDEVEDTSSKYEILYRMAYQYLEDNTATTPGSYSSLFVELLGNDMQFDRERWAVPMSIAWAQKINNLIYQESNS